MSGKFRKMTAWIGVDVGRTIALVILLCVPDAAWIVLTKSREEQVMIATDLSSFLIWPNILTLAVVHVVVLWGAIAYLKHRRSR